MRQLERDFDAVPELAALMADLLEELDELRARLGVAADPLARFPAAGRKALSEAVHTTS
jgi:hypothetical protein